MPDLLNINITDCQIDPLNFEAFSKLNNLEITEFRRSRVEIDKSYKNTNKNILTHFRELGFYNTFVSGLNRNSFNGFKYLNKLIFDKCEVCDISKDAFYDLNSITYLSIKSTEILDFDFSQILKLKSLRYLVLYDLKTNSKIDYNLFKNLPNLESILFDPWVYKDLDLEAFPKLKKCEVGVPDVEDEEEELIEDAVLLAVLQKLYALKQKKGIEYEVVCPDKVIKN